MSAEWPRTGLSGLCFGDPSPAHRPVSFQLAAAPKEVAPETLVSREDSVPNTPWHSSPEGSLLWMWLGLNRDVAFLVSATLSCCHGTKRVSSPAVPAASPARPTLDGLQGSSGFGGSGQRVLARSSLYCVGWDSKLWVSSPGSWPPCTLCCRPPQGSSVHRLSVSAGVTSGGRSTLPGVLWRASSALLVGWKEL